MAYRDLDFNLTDEQKALRDTIRKFGAEVMRPAGEKLDKTGRPQGCYRQRLTLVGCHQDLSGTGFS